MNMNMKSNHKISESFAVHTHFTMWQYSKLISLYIFDYPLLCIMHFFFWCNKQYISVSDLCGSDSLDLEVSPCSHSFSAVWPRLLPLPQPSQGQAKDGLGHWPSDHRHGPYPDQQGPWLHIGIAVTLQLR